MTMACFWTHYSHMIALFEHVAGHVNPAFVAISCMQHSSYSMLKKAVGQCLTYT